jgi:hypothetical protein
MTTGSTDPKGCGAKLKRWAELFAMDAEMLNSIIGRHNVGMWEHYTEEFVTFQKRER